MLRRSLPPLAGLAAVACGGCAEEADPIRVYTVAAVDEPAADAPAAPPRAPFADAPFADAPFAGGMTGVAEVAEPQRLLGAIAERDERLWFFKLIGPAARVAAVEPVFRDWLRTVRFVDGSPTWETPAGWIEGSGDGIRSAILRVSNGPGSPLEVGVTPLTHQTGNSVRRNLERWLGQVGREPGTGPEPEPIVLDDGTPVILLAVSSPGANDAPVAKAVPAGRSDAFTSDLPDDWEPVDAGPTELLAYRTGPGDDAAEVTVSEYPAGSMPVSQVADIWRQQAKTGEGPPIEETDPLTVGGGPAPRIELPAAGPDGTAVFGTAAERAGGFWLFKLAGSEDAVAAARPAFERFLKNFTFPQTAGAAE